MPTFRDLITDAGLELTSSERKVTRALLAPYRRNGLGPLLQPRPHLQQVHLHWPRLFTRPPRAIALGLTYFLLNKTGSPRVLSEPSNGLR
ncbi:hypothetical protein PSHI_04670 [Pseudomonas sp. URMO17WK12:I11]|nr:hypothetical protein PSHI_04670 [Pseudomonas sp. URMO17WK12:I11]